MTTLHRYLGFAIVTALAVLMLWGVGMRLARKIETPTAYRALQHYTENVLIAQAAIGIVFLLMGRRVVGEGLVWLHYFYGSLFPVIAIVGGRLSALRREEREYVGLAWGALFAWGLTMRALMIGCGGVLSLSCLTR